MVRWSAFSLRPLEGRLVVDFSTLLPGPMAGLLLAEAGAKVIKIERPGSGEEMRSYAPAWGKSGVNFALLNRGKESLAVNLKDAAERERLRPLIKRADVLIEQFRPGVMARLGLGYEDIRDINPAIIYCSITGYGQSGPKRDVAGHDLNYIGECGLLSLSMGPEGSPVLPPFLAADIAGGAYPAVINILLALEARSRTGQGCHLDIAMAENLFPLMYWALGNGLVAGQWPNNGRDLVTGGSPRYHLYPTADGRVVAAAPLEDKFWAAFCDIIDLDEPLRDDRTDPAATKLGVSAIISSRPSNYWRQRFAQRDCCCSIVATVREALDDPHFIQRGLFGQRLENDAGETIPALPVPIASHFRHPESTSLRAPELGSGNHEHLADTPPKNRADKR